MDLRSLRAGKGVALAVLVLSCGRGGSPAAPASPIPVPSTPEPTPLVVSCPFGKGTLQASCSRSAGTQLLPYFEAAVEAVAQQPAGILDLADQSPPGSGQYRIVDPKRFVEAVVGHLRGAGLCAEADYDYPVDRINVKNSPDFSEQFAFGMSSGHVRRGGPSFRAACTPATFPVDPDPSWPPSGSGCGRPYPAEIHHFNSKVWQKDREYVTLDSTPIVGPDGDYCREIGYKDGRVYCPVRPEGSPERIPCEFWRVGSAKDTGRSGPTWTLDGQPCLGLKVNGCENHVDNQYKLYAGKNGTYRMCGQSGGCGELVLGR